MKKILTLFFITCLYAVTGGLEVNPACPDCKYPFNVSIQTWDEDVLNQQIPSSGNTWDDHYCQGALVAPDWVLTTADCARGKFYNPWGDAALDFLQDLLTDNYDPDSSDDIALDQMWVEIGLHAVIDTEGKDSINVINRYIHPSYNHFAGDYNYALLQLSEPSSFESIALIQNDLLDNPGQSPIVMGWGGRSGGNATGGMGLPSFSFDAADVLHENNTMIEGCVASDSIAIGEWFEATIDFDRTICTEKFNYMGINCDPCGFGSWWNPNAPGGACFGDEGAPFVATNEDGEYELVGNFIIGCTSIDNTAIPGLYTRIYPVRDWVYSYIGYPCSEGAFVNVSIVFDDNSDETNWELWYRGQSPDGEYLYLADSGNNSDEHICILDEGVYEFIIYDEGGDGFSEYPWCSYSVTLDTGEWGTPDEAIVANGGFFDFAEATLFAWPDSDGDLIIDSQDIAPNNQFLCGDQDLDNCDDCSSGAFDVDNDCNLLGDVNQDASINVLDIILIVNHIIGDANLNQGQLILADFNNDSSIDVIDIVQIVNVIIDN